jgi:glycosyltransferase involved in cell wall biosynthesis
MYGGQDVIIAQTAHMADRVKSWLRPMAGRMVRVVPNPVDAQSVGSAADESLSVDQAVLLDGRINILFCGRLIPIKRPERALEAVELAERSAPGRLRLVFLGRGPLEAELRARAARLPAESVVFLGFESNPYKIMRACHLGLVSSDQEGFPNVILEMMAAGVRKIITTPCAGDLSGLLGVSVTDDFSAGALSAAIVEAIRDRADERTNYSSVLRARTPQAVLSQVI